MDTSFNKKVNNHFNNKFTMTEKDNTASKNEADSSPRILEFCELSSPEIIDRHSQSVPKKS